MASLVGVKRYFKLWGNGYYLGDDDGMMEYGIRKGIDTDGWIVLHLRIITQSC